MTALALPTASSADERLIALRHVAIVPAYNEEDCVAQVIDEIRAFDPGMEVAGDEGGEHQLRNVLRQRRDGREDQRRRAAQEHRCRQALSPALGDCIVIAPALSDLPVHAGRSCVVHLHPVHAEIACRAGAGRRRVAGTIRMCRVDER